MEGDLTLSAATLVGLCGLLGVGADRLAAVEGPDSLAHEFPVTATAAAALDAPTVHAFTGRFGDAARIELRTGDLTEITITSGLTDEELRAFTARAAVGGPYEAHVLVDKTALAARLAGATPARGVRLFLFAEALRRALARGITRFEEEVWPDATAPLLIAIADTDIDLRGPWLAVLGGASLPAVPDVAAARSDAPDVSALLAARDRHVGWDTRWTRQLTPWHFDLTGNCADQDLHRLLRAQLVKLVVLFTCDRARAQAVDGPLPLIRAEYRGREHVAVIVIAEQEGLDASGNETRAVLDVADWCYRRSGDGDGPDWVSDRLPFVQTRIAQTLEPHPEPQRLTALVRSMPYLLEGIEWHWKAFIEGKVGEYLAGVQQVEDTVAETVTSFAERTAGLAKSLSEAMLAAVAVLVGSFIAAAFRDPFNATLFRISVRVYAAYLVVFPGAFGSFAAHRNLRAARAGYDARIVRFRETVYTGKVDEITGTRVCAAQRSFYRWLIVVAVVYVAIAAIAWTSADAVARRVSRDKSISTTTTTTSTVAPPNSTVPPIEPTTTTSP